MRRRLILLALLIPIIGGSALLLSGYAFMPFLDSIERSVARATSWRFSIGWARLALNGNVILNNVALQRQGTQGANISEIKINPRWSSLLKRTLSVDWVKIKMGNDELLLKGILSMKAQAIDLSIETRDFPLEQIARAFLTVPKTLRLGHTGEGYVRGNINHWEIQSNGRLEQEFSGVKLKPRVSFRVQVDGDRGSIDIHFADEEMKADGKVKFHTGVQWMDGKIEITASSLASLASFWPGLETASGSLTVMGRVFGPTVSVNATGKNLRFRGMGIRNFQVELEDKGEMSKPLTLEVTASSLTWNSKPGSQRNFPHARLFWVGDANQGDLRMHFQMGDGMSLRGNGPARRSASSLQWHWAALKYISPSGKEWGAVSGGLLEIKNSGKVEVKGLKLGEEGKSLAIDGALDENSFSLGAVAENFSIEELVADFRATPRIAGILNGKILLSGTVARPVGSFDLKISSGTLGSLSLLNIRTQGSVAESSVKLIGGVVENPSLPPILFHGSFPWAWIVRENSDVAMDISLEAGPLDPAVLLKDIPEVEVKPGGSMRLEGHMTGRMGELKAQGVLSAFVPALQIPSLGIDARDAHVDIELKDQHLLIRKAEVKLGKGNLHMSGESDLPSLQLDIQGDRVSMQVRRQFGIKTDLHLELRGSLDAPTLTGEIDIAEATYEASKKKNDEKKNEIFPPLLRAWDLLRVGVKTIWANNVWYREGLTKIETQANLEVLKDRGQRDVGVRGQVTLLRGSYDAYGRDFILKSGELAFTGSSEINPQLNIQATHKMPDAVVDLDISGTAQKPELHFRSTPPMAEQDILAMLALGKVPGKSSSNAENSNKSSVSPGMDLAADVVSNYLTREVRSAGMNVLDLDVIRVSPTDKGKDWTVGRYWGSKLFLSYSYNPENSASQVMKAEYTVSPRWTLVGQSGSQSDNYLDLNFRLPVGKPR